MSEIERIREHLERFGGILVSVNGGTDVVSADMLVSRGVIAYLDAFGDRVHAHYVHEVERDGDEWKLKVNNGNTIRLSPVWAKEQRRLLSSWLEQTSPEDRARIARDLSAAAARVPPDAVPPPRPKRKYRALWFAGVGPGQELVTQGVLAQAGEEVEFISDSAQVEESVRSRIEGLLRAGWDPGKILDSLAGSGNGVTESWSLPVQIEARSAREAGTELLARRENG